MKSAIAIITYNRANVLSEELKGILEHCGQYQVAVFEDLGNRDTTEQFLREGRTEAVYRPEMLAIEWKGEGQKFQVFLGEKNLGVAGNSNRALKWFMEETDADHLCLLNDDLHVLGDFVSFYAQAHEDLGIGMLCFCDFTAPAYKWVNVKKRGYTMKLCPRMTGIMMSITRPVLERIGYFDADFGKFGEEHSDFTVRARLVGAISLDGAMQTQLDVHHYKVGEQPRSLLKHQDVETSVLGIERQRADRESFEIMKQASAAYRHRHLYREFRLWLPKFTGATRGAGIPVYQIASTYNLVTDFWPRPLVAK